MEKDLKAYVYAYLQETTHSARDGKELIDLMCEFNCDRKTMKKAVDEIMADDSMCVEESEEKYFYKSGLERYDIYCGVASYCSDCILGCLNSGSPEGCKYSECALHPFRMG